MGAEHFRELDTGREAVGTGVDVAYLRGEHLTLADWRVTAGTAWATPLNAYAECFVVPTSGTATLAANGATQALAAGDLAYLPAPGAAKVEGTNCRFVVVGWPRAADAAAAGEAAMAPRVYRFAEALRPEAPGWRFFSVDGAYMTVGCSYREAPPPARERPHSHDGEQINVALEGRFAFTVGGDTRELAPGWAALTPRGVEHTGLHLKLPYFQLIFATPPRGRDYAEFLRSIYRPRDQAG